MHAARSPAELSVAGKDARPFAGKTGETALVYYYTLKAT